MKDVGVLMKKKKWWQKRWIKVLMIILAILLVGGGIFAWKAGSIINKITIKGGLFKSLTHTISGVGEQLKGEKEGRINVLLLGMRGENVVAGGLLADTVMVLSIKPGQTEPPQVARISMISIPRDLYVNNPGWGNQTKINAVYAAGEENGKVQGLEDMKKVVGEITGLPIHYSISMNFKGFTELVDALGGIEVDLKEPFMESIQFHEERACDPNVFTIPSGNWDIKKDHMGRIKASYRLCYPDPKYIECGGNFEVPAGKSTLDGKKALCYVRSRKTSNDFERARRQQYVIDKIKEKALSVGTLSDFSKINGILDSLGNNVKTDMELWELTAFYDLYKKNPNPVVINKVLDNSEEGLLYNPPENKQIGYILLPRGDNYDQIRQLFQNIFN